MKIIIQCFLLLCASGVLAAGPATFTASRSVKHSLTEVKAAIQVFWTEAKTNYHDLGSMPAMMPTQQAGKFTLTWWDCRGAPPGALKGEISFITEPSGATRLEVQTQTSLPQDKTSDEARLLRTGKMLDAIISILERKA